MLAYQFIVIHYSTYLCFSLNFHFKLLNSRRYSHKGGKVLRHHLHDVYLSLYQSLSLSLSFSFSLSFFIFSSYKYSYYSIPLFPFLAPEPLSLSLSLSLSRSPLSDCHPLAFMIYLISHDSCIGLLLYCIIRL